MHYNTLFSSPILVFTAREVIPQPNTGERLRAFDNTLYSELINTCTAHEAPFCRGKCQTLILEYHTFG
jgi:hypothetical protein